MNNQYELIVDLDCVGVVTIVYTPEELESVKLNGVEILHTMEDCSVKDARNAAYRDYVSIVENSKCY